MATILIVDDRPVNRELLTTLLGYVGHRMLEAGSGPEGLALARAERPDLIITDLVMPVMDGYEFARLVRADAQLGQTRVVFYTSSYLVEETRQLAEACGVTHIIAKPAEPEDILRTVALALATAPQPAAPAPTEAFHEEHMRLLTDKLAAKVDELQTSEAELRALFAAMTDVILVLDKDGTYVKIAPTNPPELYRPPQVLVGQRLHDTFSPKEADALVGHIRQALATQQPVPFEYHMVIASQTVWFEATVSPMGPDRVFLVARNITARKQAEGQLRLQSAALNAAANGIVITDREGTIEWMNRAVTSMTGYTPDEAIGKNPRELFKSGQQDAAMYRNLWDTVLAGGVWRGELVNRRKDGSLYTEEQTITPLVEPDGRISHFIAVKQDITERKRVEASVLDSEAHLRTLFDNAPISIWEEDLSAVKDYLDQLPGGPPADMDDYLTQHPEVVAACVPLLRVIDVNQATVTLLEERDKSALLGGLVVILPPESHAVFQRELVAMARGETRLRQDAVVITRAGQRREVTLDWVVVPGHEARYSRVLLSLVDITERKQAEQATERQLHRMSALRAIDMAINASLDLRLTLQIVLDQVMAELGVDAAAVYLVNASQNAVEFAAGRGFSSASAPPARVRLGQDFAGRLVLERRSLAVPDVSLGEARGQPAAWLRASGFRSYYGLPLISKGTVTGVLEVLQREPRPASQEWLDFLEALAGQAAIAIDNSALFANLQQSNQALSLAYDATIEGWSRALDLRDHETEGHSQRVTELTLELAARMGIAPEQLVHLRRGALLHDIGKMGIPDRVLLKPEPLSEDEWLIMRQHPAYAFNLLSPIAYLRPALDIPYCHHEKWDGSGYPRQLKGEAIPLSARIFAIVDVWDALTSDRPYRRAWPKAEVRAHIRGLDGTHFDPAVVAAFEELMAEQP